MLEKPLRKEEREEVLHRFYEIGIYDVKNKKEIEVTEEIENRIFSYDEMEYWDINFIEKHYDVFNDLEINIEKLISYYEKYKNAKNKDGKTFDKIIFTWNEGCDGDEYCHRISGVTIETDEEFNERIKEWKEYEKKEKQKREERKKKRLEEKNKKEKILNKLSDEEKKLLGVKNRKGTK